MTCLVSHEEKAVVVTNTMYAAQNKQPASHSAVFFLVALLSYKQCSRFFFKQGWMFAWCLYLQAGSFLRLRCTRNRVGGGSGAFVAAMRGRVHIIRLTRIALQRSHLHAALISARLYCTSGISRAIDRRSRALRRDEVQRQQRAGCHSRKVKEGNPNPR